jgi:hypothetical protein
VREAPRPSTSRAFKGAAAPPPLNATRAVDPSALSNVVTATAPSAVLVAPMRLAPGATNFAACPSA